MVGCWTQPPPPPLYAYGTIGYPYWKNPVSTHGPAMWAYPPIVGTPHPLGPQWGCGVQARYGELLDPPPRYKPV